MKELRLRWDSMCARCGATLAARTVALWDRDTKSAFCLQCPESFSAERLELAEAEPPSTAPVVPTTRGSDAAGASAQREYERRSARERQRKEREVADDAAWRAALIEKRPVLGRVRASFVQKPRVGPESHATTAWKVGAEGERRVAEILAACPEVESLHDLRIPGSRANIDHIAVAPAGAFVIDAKKYVGAVELRDVGTWLRPDVRLTVGGRNRTHLTEGVSKQMLVVKASLAETPHAAVPVFGVLCFVGAEWPLIFRKPVTVNGVTAVWPDGLPSLLRPKRPSTTIEVRAVAHHLRSVLRPA